MNPPTPKFPKTEEVLKAYGDSLLAQSKALGFPYMTLREWLVLGNLPGTLIRLACWQDVYRALGEDIADQREILYPPTDEQVAA